MVVSFTIEIGPGQTLTVSRDVERFNMTIGNFQIGADDEALVVRSHEIDDARQSVTASVLLLHAPMGHSHA